MLLGMDGDGARSGEDSTTSSITLYFESSSMVRDRKCAVFETVKDTIVEMDEVMNFRANTENEFDMFVDGSNMFSLNVIDDDGMVDV